MRLAKTVLDFAMKRSRPFAGLVLGAAFLGEVALALDVGVLEAVGPGANLTGTGLGEGDESGEFRFEI